MAIVLVRLCVGIWQSMASTTHAIRGTNDVCWAARSKKGTCQYIQYSQDLLCGKITVGYRADKRGCHRADSIALNTNET